MNKIDLLMKLTAIQTKSAEVERLRIITSISSQVESDLTELYARIKRLDEEIEQLIRELVENLGEE